LRDAFALIANRSRSDFTAIAYRLRIDCVSIAYRLQSMHCKSRGDFTAIANREATMNRSRMQSAFALIANRLQSDFTAIMRSDLTAISVDSRRLRSDCDLIAQQFHSAVIAKQLRINRAAILLHCKALSR
jgi:hypothetical protein